STGSPIDIICITLFPFSLKDKAKIWFHALTPNSIRTWEELQKAFLEKFFPPARTNMLMRMIQNFTEEPNEAFTGACDRYKDLINANPHHVQDEGQLVGYFYHGLTRETKQFLQMMSGGELFEKSPEQAIPYFDRLSESARNWEVNTTPDVVKRGSTPSSGGKFQLKEQDDLQVKVANLTRKLEALEMQKVNEVTAVPVVPNVPPTPIVPRVEEPCLICEDPIHSTRDCPTLPT
ncbi:retrotransposon gag domain-containing protein, partial [Solirubrobacter sp. CPCC 204708]|nr:retrotransposon gag domain-containing protein [Solirubrobacter deserti]